MSWQPLLVLLALLVMLTVMGFGLGAGQPELPEDALPEPPAWLERLGARLDPSRPVELAEITGCRLRDRTLRMLANRSTATCHIAKADARSRRLDLHLDRGRVVIRARLHGDDAVQVRVELPDDDIREGSLRVQREGAELSVRCDSAPCDLRFVEPEDS